MLVLSKKRVSQLASMTQNAIRKAVQRGRLDQVDILVEGTVRRGISFRSLREYYGWSQALCDQILDPHGLSEEQDVFWTEGEEDKGEDA